MLLLFIAANEKATKISDGKRSGVKKVGQPRMPTSDSAVAWTDRRLSLN